MDKVAPVKLLRVKQQKEFWFSDEILNLIQVKNIF